MAISPQAAGAAGNATLSAPERAPISLDGLRSPVTVRRDARGIPYIEAANEHDLFFVQGFVTAGDRLWQMDLMRRTARGQLSEILGRDLLEQDAHVRVLGLGGLADGLVDRVSARMRAALVAYADGVNAFIASAGSGRLPPEFGLLGYEPAKWRAADSLAVVKLFALDLDTTWPMDVMRAAFSALPAEKRAAIFPEESPLDVVLVGGEKTARASGRSAKVVAAPAIDAGTMEAARKALSHRAAWRGRPAPGSGALAASNNWVVSGARSATGKPMLANDPHLAPTAPSIWYLVHLSAPGIRVAGAASPGAIGVLLGHNERIAWGATNLMADVQDLYAESFEGGKYATPAGPREPQVRKERILVRAGGKDGSPEAVEREVTVTRHGPIVLEAEGRRFALRWTALYPDACEAEVFFDLQTASSWKEFTGALRRHPGPPLSLVYADVAGHIGWYAAGRIPRRAAGDGTVPYDGSTDTGEWTGYVPFDDLPHLLDPPSGIIVTANNRVVGSGYPDLITRAWNVPYRARRIADLLAARPKLSADDHQSIQADTYSYADAIFAREVVEVAKAQGDARPEWAAMVRELEGWDGRVTPGSRALPLVVGMRRAFAAKVLEAALGAGAETYSWPNRDTLIDEIVTTRPSSWLPEGSPGFPDLLLDCWAEARAKIAGRAGDDEREWTWARVGPPIEFRHPLADVPDAGTRFLIDPLPGATDGSGETVNAGALVSMRFIADPSDWDRSRLGIALGQSGDPASPHWKDQMEAWRAVSTPSFPFSPEAVERAAVETTILAPAAPAGGGRAGGGPRR